MNIASMTGARSKLLGIKRRAEAIARGTNQAPEMVVQEELEAPVGSATRPTACNGTISADLAYSEPIAVALRQRPTIRGAPHHNTDVGLNSD